MALLEKAKVFMSGRSQAVRIPARFRFSSTEVFIRRDPNSGDLILSQAPTSLEEIFAALDELGVPEDFLFPSDRAQGLPQERPEL
jgi:antitoxin VapB